MAFPFLLIFGFAVLELVMVYGLKILVHLLDNFVSFLFDKQDPALFRGNHLQPSQVAPLSFRVFHISVVLLVN